MVYTKNLGFEARSKFLLLGFLCIFD